MPRLKYTVAQQIASMKSHGVSFALCDEDAAAEFLTSRTYFFKLKAFENNFERVGDRYTGLDFAYLKDLSTIDFHLRTLLSYCCLNIEHALKVRFNRLIMDDPAEDGYDVVHRFDPDGEFRFHGDYRHSRYHHSVYTEGLLRKYFDDPAVWNLWETVDFSTLCRLYQSYIDSRGMKDNSTNLFRSVRILRNAASHGNCLIIGIHKDIRPTRYVKNCLSELDRLTGSNTTPLYSSLRRYPLVHDFASVLCAFLILVDSPGIRSDVAKQLEEFSRRLCALRLCRDEGGPDAGSGRGVTGRALRRRFRIPHYACRRLCGEQDPSRIASSPQNRGSRASRLGKIPALRVRGYGSDLSGSVKYAHEMRGGGDPPWPLCSRRTHHTMRQGTGVHALRRSA